MGLVSNSRIIPPALFCVIASDGEYLIILWQLRLYDFNADFMFVPARDLWEMEQAFMNSFTKIRIGVLFSVNLLVSILLFTVYLHFQEVCFYHLSIVFHFSLVIMYPNNVSLLQEARFGLGSGRLVLV